MIVDFSTAKQFNEKGVVKPPNSPHLVMWYVVSGFEDNNGNLHSEGDILVSMLGYMAMEYYVPLAFTKKPFLIGKNKDKIIYAPPGQPFGI